jgi:hypothetical protein
MKVAFAIIAICAGLFPATIIGQSAPRVPTMPTTKILAIGNLTTPLSSEEIKTLLPPEVRQTVNLYLNGKIDQWWSRQDGGGVVFLLNVTSIEEAQSILGELPLGIKKKMTFQFLPLGPLNPLRLLLKESTVDTSLGSSASDSVTKDPQ